MQFVVLFAPLVAVGATLGVLLFLWRSRALDDALLPERLLLPLAIGLLLMYPGLQYLTRTTQRLVRNATESVLDTCFSAPLPELEPTSRRQIIVRSSNSAADEDYVFDEVFGVIPRAVLEEWSQSALSREQMQVRRRIPPVRAFPHC